MKARSTPNNLISTKKYYIEIAGHTHVDDNRKKYLWKQIKTILFMPAIDAYVNFKRTQRLINHIFHKSIDKWI